MCVLVVAYVDENYLGVMRVLYIPNRRVIAWVIHVSKVIMDFITYKSYLIKIALKVIEFTCDLDIFKYLCYVTVKTL